METINVKAIRTRLGLTQGELAAKLGVGINTVSRWENGHNTPYRVFRHRLLELAEEEKKPC